MSFLSYYSEVGMPYTSPFERFDRVISRSPNTVNSYSEEGGFESRLRYWLSFLRVFVVFLSLSSEIPDITPTRPRLIP
jgi:hypothetical protein